jgi:hypothetical protein
VAARFSPSNTTPAGGAVPVMESTEGATSMVAKTEVSLWLPALLLSMSPGAQAMSGERIPPS